jgi:hypothetical protein
MSTSDSTVAVTNPLRPLRNDTQVTSLALSVQQLCAARPGLLDAARITLQDLLDERYPTLGITANSAVILEPRWSLVEGQRRVAGYRSHGLTDLLLERCRGVDARAFSPESFLSFCAGEEFPREVGVPLTDIQQMLDEWGPLLLECYQHHLLDFWSQPREGGTSAWGELCDLFREQLQQASLGLASEELATVQAVLDYPDNAHRQRVLGDATTQASITFVYDDDSDLHPDDVLVMSMTRDLGNREIALLYTLTGGIEVFSSVAAMEESWFGLRQARYRRLRNYTPEHDIFDALTLSLLERQLQVIAAIKPSAFTDSASLERRVEQLSSPGLLLGAFRSGHETRLSTLQDLLPSWLKNAPMADRRAYSRLLSSLATLHRTSEPFMTGIPTILEYASQRLKAKMLEDDRMRTDVAMSDIVVTLKRVSNSAFEIIDPPYPSPRHVSETLTFPPMAVRNIGAFPYVESRVSYKGGEPPAWLTYDYLRELTTRADIGKTYPLLLQHKLLDDPVECARRQKHFCDSLSFLLPLVALELKIKKSLTDLACRYVCAVLQAATFDRHVAGNEVVVRPLAFLTHVDATADVVGNMFVIGPKDVSQGPHILYRPSSPIPLIEFASWVVLLDAIKEGGELQESVLDGLSTVARPIYANGGFQEPHRGRVIVSDFDLPLSPEPALLSSAQLQGDVASALYKACAQALIEQARQVSVSDSQARRDSFKQFAWATFNLLLPLFSGPVAAVGLLVQLTASLDEFVKSENAENHWEALTSVLMNLALVLVHAGSPLSGISRLDELQVAGDESAVRRVTLDSAIHNKQYSPYGAKARLAYGWSSPRGRFSARELVNLETFKRVAPPSPVSSVTSGEYRGLYQQGSLWFANVEGDWFRVSRKLEGVVIIDAAHPARTGPWLKSDGQGQWTYAYGPRLLGGAGGLSVRAARKLKTLKKEGSDLLATLNQQIAEAGWLSRSNRAPVDVEELFTGASTRFKDCAAKIADLTRTLGDQAPQTLIDDLSAAARQLQDLGRTTRIAMTKSNLPTVGAVEYLLQEKEISIRQVGGRTDISGGKRTDFLQEYEIRDTSNKVLWYAHFHYLKNNAAADAFSKAHLKTFAQRRQGLVFQKNQQQSGQSIDRIWRADIGSAAARKFFLQA